MNKTSQPSPAAPPRRNIGVLAELRRAVRRACLQDGLVWLVLGLVIACVLSFVLDYFLHLPVVVRAVIIGVVLVALAILALRRLVAPLSHRFTDDELALLIEETHPELHESLITAVQLSKPDSFGGRWVSQELLGEVIRDVESRAEHLEPDRVIRRTSLRRNGLLLGIALLVIGACVIWRADLFQLWARRNLLLSSEAWPKRVELRLEESTPLAVAIGDPLPVVARLVRGNPQSVRIEWQSTEASDAKDFRVDSMEVREQGTWDVWLESTGDALGQDAARVAELIEHSTGSRTGNASASGAGNTSDPEDLVRLREAVESGSGLVASGLDGLRADTLVEELTAQGAVVRKEGFDVALHEFRNVSEPFRFWVSAGDDRIGPFDVTVRLRPRIDMQSIELSYEYPAYTGQSGEVHTQQLGNVKVPAGTRVQFRMATNIPVESAALILEKGVDRRSSRGRGASAAGDSSSVEEAPVPVPLELVDGRRFSGSFVVEEDGYYWFQFADEQGFAGGRPERFRVQSIRDNKPVVSILEPNRLTEEVTPEAEIPIRIEIRDDYAVHSATLEGTYYAPGSDVPVRMSISLDGVGGETPRLARQSPTEVELLLRVSDIRTGSEQPPVPESRFEFFALAEDFGGDAFASEGGVGNIGESQVHLLSIVDRDYLEQTLVDQLSVVQDMVVQLQAKQQSVRQDLEEFQDRSTLAGEISREEGRKLARYRQDQEKVGEGIDRQVADIDRLLAKMESNKVGDDEWKSWLSRVQTKLRDVGKRQSPDVAAQIDQLRRDTQAEPQDPDRVSPTLAAQGKIEQDLNTVAIELSHFGDLSGVIQQLRELRLQQQRIRDSTRDALGTDNTEEPR